MSQEQFPDISSSPRLRIPTPPATCDDLEPTELEITVANHLWRPMLEHIDPDDGRPDPLNPAIYAQLLALLRKAHLPNVLVGSGGASVVQHVSSALRRLQGAGRRQMDARKVFAAVDDLCDCTEPHMVHQLAAAFGGRRLLRDRLALLGDEVDPALMEQGKRIYEEWCYERRRLRLRWPRKAPKWQEDAKFSAIIKIAEVIGAEEVASPQDLPAHTTRPELLTPPSAPRTANLHPSPLLRMGAWDTGDEEKLISWLDKHTAEVHVPRGYQRNKFRSKQRRSKLPPMAVRGTR